jgi:hypothetical protein
MNVKEFDSLVESIISSEIKKAILMESINKKYDVFHIKCDNEPVESCETEEEAQEVMDKLKKEHPDKQFIIEKTQYESHEDMIHKLDEMGQQLEKKENGDMKNTQMDEKLVGNQTKLDKNHNGKIDAQDFKIMKGQQDEEECMECGDGYMEENDAIHQDVTQDYSPINENELCECGGMVNEDGICNECGMPYQSMEEHAQDGDPEHVCPKCGKQVCECYSLHENKKRTVRITEAQLIDMISKMVSESMPGYEAYTKAHKESGTQNKKELDDMMKDVEKNYLSFDNNDKPEFPHQLNSKTKKQAYTNSEEQDEETAKNFAGLQNLDYDLEPSEAFKKRQKMAIEGDVLMGNAPVTDKPSIKPSNGAPMGKEAKEKQGNHIPTPQTAKKMETQMKDREKDKKDRVLYSKEKIPVSESKLSFSSVLLEEMNKMKNLSSYNKKTQ